jgi:WD40 repeat protein
VKDPNHRPTASTVCDSLSHMSATTVTVQTGSAPSSSQLAIQVNPLGPLAPSPNLTLLRHTEAVTARQAFVPPSNLTAQAYLPLSNLTLHGHTDEVYCAAFSPDGKYIVSGSRNKMVLIWDAQTGNHVLGPLKRHTKSVYCVAFSPDGRQIALGPLTIQLWYGML